jgi:hypothetical protein
MRMMRTHQTGKQHCDEREKGFLMHKGSQRNLRLAYATASNEQLLRDTEHRRVKLSVLPYCSGQLDWPNPSEKAR